MGPPLDHRYVNRRVHQQTRSDRCDRRKIGQREGKEKRPKGKMLAASMHI